MASTRRVVNVLALTLVGVFLIIIGVIAIIIYWPSEWTFWGMSNVNVRHIHTTYASDEVAAGLAHRNLIIESRNTNVEIRVRKFEQYNVQDNRGTITLFENARGLSFNNIHRTHVGLTQTFVGDDVFYRLRVVEPTGAVVRNSNLVINLVGDEDEFNGAPYNFILDTRGGAVNFTADQDVEHMLINSVTIMPTTNGPIRFPSIPTQAFPFAITLNYLNINSNFANVAVPQGVRRAVEITSSFGSVNTGNIGLEAQPDALLRVTSSTNISVTTSNVWGHIEFASGAGSLIINGQQGVSGPVDFSTNTARLQATQIHGRLDIESRVASNISITTTQGPVDAEFVAGGSLNITNVFGAGTVYVRSHSATITIGGTGTTAGVSQGARIPVRVYNHQGSTAVNFARGADAYGAPTLNFNGFDGNITATRIAGPANIFIASGGRATITASFAVVAMGTSTIHFQGATQANTNFGNVNITLLTVGQPALGLFEPFHLQVEGTRGARDFTGWPVRNILGNTSIGVEIPNWHHDGPWQVRGGNPSRVLRIITSNQMTMRASAG